MLECYDRCPETKLGCSVLAGLGVPSRMLSFRYEVNEVGRSEPRAIIEKGREKKKKLNGGMDVWRELIVEKYPWGLI